MTTIEHRPVDRRPGTVDTTANIVLGIWLFISAFIWPHTDASRMNTWICGLLVAALAVATMWIRPVRWLNAALGLWVVVGAVLIPHGSAGTLWNNLIVGLLVLLISVGGLTRPMPQSPMP